MIVLNMVVTLVTVVVLQMTGMFVFSKLTPFNDLEELKKGNSAVGLAMGGKFLATAIILCVASFTNHSIWYMMLWFAVGYVCLLITYKLFDWLTPGIRLSEQLQQGNTAVGILLACVYIGISLAIGTIIA